MRDEYDQRMDALAKKIGKVLDGVNLFEAASACAMGVAYCIAKLEPENRDQAEELLVQFIRNQIASDVAELAYLKKEERPQ